MNAYYYTPSDCGMDGFPDSGLRLQGFESVMTPDAADVFVVSPIIRSLLSVQPNRTPRATLDALPYFNAATEARHVLWNIAEDPIWFDSTALFLRCDATKEIQAHDPNTHGFAWPVQDLRRPLPVEFRLDVVFQGWTSTPLTHTVVESVRRSLLPARVHLEEHDFFYGYHDGEPDYESYRTMFLDTLSDARLSLSPDSIPGIPRYRFYEALSMGRVPVLIGDGHVLPFEEVIDYDEICLRIPESLAEQTGDILKNWLGLVSDHRFIAMATAARRAWERYMNREHWMEQSAEIVTVHLKTL